MVAATEPPKATHPWRERKGALAERASTDRELGALIVADKCHNLRCLLDAEAAGEDPFAVVSGSPADNLWLTRTLIAYTGHHDGAVFESLREALPAIEAIDKRHRETSGAPNGRRA